LVVGPNFVISIQEEPGDCFDPVRQRIRAGKGRSRRMGPDYLAYTLIDAVVDNYFVILERLGEKIESLEEELMERPTRELLHTIHELKREMILLRRAVWPLREVAGRLERGESGLVKHETRVFLRDLYDHTIQVIDGVESYRDMLTGLQDLYLSSVSNKLNEVMKVLTIIATLFIPVSFFAGVFGMNFDYMPELRWKWSYPIFWAVIASAIGGMLMWFRRKRWL
jgi:magnesium transporter